MVYIFRILGKCLLISSLLGNSLRILDFMIQQHAFLKQSLVNIISKDIYLVFYLSFYPKIYF